MCVFEINVSTRKMAPAYLPLFNKMDAQLALAAVSQL